MSYLHTPRIQFTGDFRADTSTVNNDVRHYDNTRFEPDFQQPQDSSALHGWWNPTGGNQFNLLNCTVRQTTFPDGTRHTDPNDDPVLGQIVAAPGDKGTGKMLDLDPQWQMASELWCVKIRIYSQANELLLEGEMATSAFRDLQTRQTDGGAVNGQPMGACWTSVLTHLNWGPAADRSPALRLLRATTHRNQLSIRLNMFGFYYNHADGRFSMGRILGSIGPWFENEPLTFPASRRLYGTAFVGPASAPSLYFNYTDFLVDTARSIVSLDLGNSFPVDDSMGSIHSANAQYFLGIANKPQSNDPASTQVILNEGTDFDVIGQVPYTAGNADWLNTTGGIVDMGLTSPQLEALKSAQLLLLQKNGGNFALIAREAVEGYLLRADNFIQRLDTGDRQDVRIYCFQWGSPLPNVEVNLSIQPKSQALFGPVKTGDGTSKIEVPWINIPTSGLTMNQPAPTDAGGATTLSLTGNEINNPRGYLDGQVYYISYQSSRIPVDNASYSMDGIYVHLRDHYPIPENPTWADVSQVFIQFGNVYPLMSRFIVDLGSESAVLSKRDILIYAFTRDIQDTFYMPVTRDLSEAKRQTIVKWLQTHPPGPDALSTNVKRYPSPPAQPSPTAPEASTPPQIVESDHVRRVRLMTMKKNGANKPSSK